MNKKAIRSLYAGQRAAMDPDKVRACSLSIFHQFSQGAFPPVRHLLSYVPLLSKNEFDVTACEKYLLQNNPEMVLAKPRIDPSLQRMDACRISPYTVYADNQYGIPEPVHAEVIDPKELDMVFVPLLAFDMQGYRVGYGKGYYDRFLARCRKQVFRVGFSCFDPLHSIEDISQFDVPLTHCITPLRIYEFQRPVA